MKATLEFYVREEDMEFRQAIDGWKWQNVIQRMYEWVRAERKYKGKNAIDVDECNKKLYEEVEESGLDLWS